MQGLAMHAFAKTCRRDSFESSRRYRRCLRTSKEHRCPMICPPQPDPTSGSVIWRWIMERIPDDKPTIQGGLTLSQASRGSCWPCQERVRRICFLESITFRAPPTPDAQRFRQRRPTCPVTRSLARPSPHPASPPQPSPCSPRLRCGSCTPATALSRMRVVYPWALKRSPMLASVSQPRVISARRRSREMQRDHIDPPTPRRVR
jgi:hypothetical protein